MRKTTMAVARKQKAKTVGSAGLGEEGSGNALKEVALFLILTFALSSIFYFMLVTGSKALDAMTITLALMWCPAVAALATRFAFHRNFGGLGWGLGEKKYLAIAFLLPVIVGIASYGLVWLSGYGAFNQEAAAKMFSISFLPSLLLYLVFNIFAASGEEIGWRGLLVPQLAKMMSFTKLALLSGVIWALWHFPLIIFGGYNAGGPLWYSLTVFSLCVVPAAFVFAWIRLKSGSLWSTVLLHGSWNFFIQVIFDRLTLDTGLTKYITGEFGFAMPVVYIILAIAVWRMRDRLPNQ